MTNFSAADLSRAISHALRHEPWLYDIELDDDGFGDLDVLVASLREADDRFAAVTRAVVERVVAESGKRRHEIVGGRIRALYGHSLPGPLRKVEGNPPEELFHGTTDLFLNVIVTDGLRPMGRQYVHLSVDVATAKSVGVRKEGALVLVRVRAREAHEAGVKFFIGNEAVWLADLVPPEYLEVV